MSFLIALNMCSPPRTFKQTYVGSEVLVGGTNAEDAVRSERE